MESLSKSDEQLLLNGVKTAVDLVDNHGMTPDEALQKVAQKYDYSPGFLKAACNAFNTGRQLAQWQANDSVLDKLASFPLADFEKISSKIWAPKEKTAQISYNRPEFNSYEKQARQELLSMNISSFTKQANELNQATIDSLAEERIKKAYDHLDYYRRLAEQARTEKTASATKLDASLGALKSYFSKSAYDRLPFAQVEQAVSAYYGKVGSSLMEHMAEYFPKEKRAADQPKNWEGFYRGVDRSKAPFNLIDAIIKQAENYQQTVTQLDVANMKVTRATAAVTKLAADLEPAEGVKEPFNPSIIDDSKNNDSIPDAPSLEDEMKKQTQKQSFAGAASAGSLALNLSLANNLGKYVSSDKDKNIQGEIEKLDSPEHVNELRKIKAQTLLTGLMSDPDNPLSKHDPEEVLSAYNQMVQLAPRLADQPAALGPLLNKRMVGNIEPFELLDTLKMEEAMRGTQPKPAYLTPSQPKAKAEEI
jgi:hypothetical protein